MPKKTQKVAKADKSRSKCQEDPIDFSKLPEDLKTLDEVWKKERGNTRKKNKSSRLQEKREMELAEQKSEEQEDQKELINPTAEKTPAIKNLSQEQLLDSSPEDLKTPDEVWNKERRNTQKKNRFRCLQEEREMELAEQKSEDQEDQEELQNPTADKTPALLEAEYMETIKKLSKKDLIEECLQLRKDYVTTEQKLKKKLQKEKTQRKLLREELEMKKASNTDVQESESEVPAQQQQAGLLNPETEEKLKSLEDRVLNDQRDITNLTAERDTLTAERDTLTAERDTLTQEMAEINILKEEAIKKQEDLLEENEELKHELSLKKCLHQENEELKHELSLKTCLHQENEELKHELSLKTCLHQENEELKHELSLKKCLHQENEELKHELSLKKCLEQENEELKERIKTSQEEFNAEPQLAKQNNILLQQHYQALGVAYQKLGEAYQTQVVTVRNQAVNLQNQLKTQVQSNANRKREDQWLIRKLKTDLKALQGKTSATIISQKKYFLKIIEGLSNQLNSLRDIREKYDDLKEEYDIRQEEFNAELQPEKQKHLLLQEDHESLRESYIELSKKYEAVIITLQQWAEEATQQGLAIQVQEEPEDTEINSIETATTVTPQEEPEALTPVSETVTPVSETATPVSETVTPVSETATPVSETETPVSETATPVSETATPDTETETPDTETETPAAETETPAAETETPDTETDIRWTQNTWISRHSVPEGGEAAGDKAADATTQEGQQSLLVMSGGEGYIDFRMDPVSRWEQLCRPAERQSLMFESRSSLEVLTLEVKKRELLASGSP
ncbi:nuclear mitotic apparatus protein 1-like [Notolabrus celidotus]|uniref:nuclear mitotic apparatus protein 1-like n=1 Tax=Notolabrus celidotus TaxID=1203425 RepID=UPI00148F80F3|nr:nuclear mitotic apparatus protein 1-like [Notolabrus celidotus]